MARIIALLVVALFAGVANAVVVPGLQQCGGTSTKKGVASVQGGAWKGYVCAAGYVCKSQNLFYSQCVAGTPPRADKPVVLPKPSKGAKGCTYTVVSRSQCAGISNVPKGLKVRGEKWPGVCCPAKSKCVRQNKFYSQCS